MSARRVSSFERCQMHRSPPAPVRSDPPATRLVGTSSHRWSPSPPRLVGVRGHWDSKLSTDCPGKSRPDVFVTRDGRHLFTWTSPLRVLRAADFATAVGLQMTLEVATLHAAAVNRRCSRSDPGVSPTSSSSGVSTVRRASSAFSRASSRVRPWLIAPGTSRTRATIQPSSSGLSKEIVKSTDAAMREP